MFNRKLCTGSAVLACLALFRIATAAPAFKILYHERLDITPRVDAQGQQHVSFDAYGRHFDLNLESNENIRRGVPANRSDIRPYRGAVAGQEGSWVRLTQTRSGWRGVIFDGHELYAIEPEAEVGSAVAQSSSSTGDASGSGLSSGGSSSSTPVMYRLADTLMPDSAGYCGTGEDSDSITRGSKTSKATALNAYSSISKELSLKDTSTGATTKQLVVSVVADHEFTDSVGSDPEGAIVARMDVVDGIWSSQVGIEIVLGQVKVLTDTSDTFSATTVPADLLAEVATYRGKLPSGGSGLTHLMTGRTLDGNIIGIAYLGAVCDGNESASLSQSTASMMEGALVAAHELGHNFSAVHDGVSGACSSTPQTYLMAPSINFNNQFSSCSLGLINTLVKTASCLKTVAPSSGSTSADSGAGTTPSSGGTSGGGTSSGSTSSGAGDTVSNPTTSGTSTTSAGGSGGGGSLDLVWLAFLGPLVLLQRALPIQRRQQARKRVR
jgi:hypothetical protein